MRKASLNGQVYVTHLAWFTMKLLNYICSRTICVQYLRILCSSFGEEDFQRFVLN